MSLSLRPLADHVRSLREARGLSVEDAAAHAGITPNIWRAIESAKHDPTIDTLRGLSVALQTPAHEILEPLYVEALRQAEGRAP